MNPLKPRLAAASALLLPLGAQASLGTSLYFFSESGDYIGQGVESTWTQADGTFNVSRNYDDGITVSFNGDDWWTLNFAAPGEVTITPGVYQDAARFPFQNGDQPGLSVSGSGRGCNTLTGQFQVLEVSYEADGSVAQLAADFEQHCEGDPAGLFGSIRVNSDLPVTRGHSLLRFDSETGDYIGQGLVHTWTPEDGSFGAERNFDQGVSIDFDGLTPSTWWSLDFAAAQAVDLERGAYEDATRFPFNAESEPGLSISGSGRGCNTLSGRFDVLEARYSDAGSVERFAADFEQHCEGADPALFGSIRFDSFEEISDGFTLLGFDSEPGDYIGQGHSQTWRRSTGQFSVSRNYDEGVTLRYEDDDPGEDWTLDFAAPGNAALEVGTYDSATRFPFQAATDPGLSVSGSGRGCNTLTGTFDVLEIAYTDSGDVEKLAIDFEQHCNGAEPALHGAIRFNSRIQVSETPIEDGDGAATPWQTNASGYLRTDIGFNYAMGYRFTPQEAGEITALGGFFNGTKTVRLFDDTTGQVLAETSVTAANDWAYQEIDAVPVVAGQSYRVAVYLAGSGASYRYGTESFPRTYGDIRIEGTVYAPTYQDASARPRYFWAGTIMYGQADVRFAPLP
ncbi:DUF4082 domain-containing protein [Thiorhodococcus minor]|uniref:DUF4082 domain-containing protein n=1 Tax=Thiorhodococcus minor TaxID=57489 RepID=A0A6M0K475_9GAMM|nr:DUF4082 domain-containing protein [Thiorhodococcus minor]NEV63155.1 DUF4082 domain-containing protein [Thiorhodococcus minor]